MTVRARLDGIDAARGLAVISMVDAHAFDGWVAPEHRASAAFGVTRVVATLALPSFLFLAGVGVGFAALGGAERGTDPRVTRSVLVRRGLLLVVAGYATSVAYALMDGARGVETILRADVLHAIGLSIAVAVLVALGGGRRRLVAASAVLAVASVAVCAPATGAAAAVEGPARFVLGLFVETPGAGHMPVVPLLGWLAIGVALAPALFDAARAGRLGKLAIVLGAAGALLVAVGLLGTRALTDAIPGRVDRAHLAIVPSFVDFTGRALLVLAAGVGIARAPRAVVRPLVLLGGASLVVYVAHIPFCYGALGRPLARSLDVATAAVPFVALVTACVALAWGREVLRRRRRERPAKEATA